MHLSLVCWKLKNFEGLRKITNSYRRLNGGESLSHPPYKCLYRHFANLQSNIFISFWHTVKILLYRHPLNTDTSLLWTVCFVPVKKSHTFTLNSTHLNTNTLLIQTFSMAPSVSVLTGFHFITLKLGKFTQSFWGTLCQIVHVNIENKMRWKCLFKPLRAEKTITNKGSLMPSAFTIFIIDSISNQ